MDPRIQTSLEDLRKQHEMEMGAVEGMNDSYESLEQVKSVRAQIKDLSKKVAREGQAGEESGRRSTTSAPNSKAPSSIASMACRPAASSPRIFPP